MAGSYSLDLRSRVVADVEQKASAEAAATKYSVSVRTVYDWLHLKRESGSLQPRGGKRGAKPKLEEDRVAILQKLENEPDLTLENLRTLFQFSCCLQTISNALSRWRITLRLREKIS